MAVHKSQSRTLKASTEDNKTATLLDFLVDLDHDVNDMTPRTPSLSGSATTCEEDDWDDAARVRRISNQLCAFAASL
jgi:hypothetical protein